MIIFISPIITEKKGKLPGKNILVLAGVHGNESFGVDAINEVISSLKITKGKVTFIIANPEAIKQNKRFIEFNLNRCFLKLQPNEIYDSLEGKIARKLMPYLEDADWLLDIHGSNSQGSIPFIICEEQSFEVAKQLPFDIISYNWDRFQPGSSDYYMNTQNKIGICAECGYLGDSSSKEKAKQTITDFLILAGSIKGKIKNNPEKKFIKIASQYKNRYGKFKKSRNFKDFELLDKNEVIGKDKNKKIYAKSGDRLLFVRDRENIGEECFLIAKETLLNSRKFVNILNGG